MTPDGYNCLVRTRYKPHRGSSERRAWRSMVAPSFLSLLSFFPFMSPERPPIHSCCKQSLELAPQHHDDASRLASPRLASPCNHRAAIHTFIVSQMKRINLHFLFLIFFRWRKFQTKWLLSWTNHGTVDILGTGSKNLKAIDAQRSSL